MPTFQVPIMDSRSASKYAQAQLCRLDVMSKIGHVVDWQEMHWKTKFLHFMETKISRHASILIIFSRPQRA